MFEIFLTFILESSKIVLDIVASEANIFLTIYPTSIYFCTMSTLIFSLPWPQASNKADKLIGNKKEGEDREPRGGMVKMEEFLA